MPIKIETRSKDEYSNLIEIYLNEDLWGEVHSSIFGRKPGFTPCDTLDQFEEQFCALEYRQTKSYALKRLSIKSYPTSELVQKLEERCVSEKNIQKVIKDLKRLNYLNDREWIENFVRQQSGKSSGPRVIAQKLQAKGLPEALISEALAHLDDSEAQISKIVHLLTTKYRSKNLSDFKERQKVVGSLMRKGFNFSHIKPAIEQASHIAK